MNNLLLSKINKHFELSDPKIAPIIQTIDYSAWFEEEGSDYFESLVRNIVYQQLAGSAASAIYARFVAEIGGEVNPQNILAKDKEELRKIGLSYAKASYILDLATKTRDKELILDNLHDLSDEQIVSELTKVKGIGRWTAEMFLMFTLRRPDIFSFGDLGLKRGLAKLYGISDPTPDDMAAITTAWSPYRTYGAIALWHHLDNR